MFLTVHVTAGALVGTATANPIIGFVAGFISHFVLDIIPHGDQELSEGKDNFTPKIKKLILILGVSDTLLMMSLSAALLYFEIIPLSLSVLAAMAGAVVPDYINAIYIFTKVKFLRAYNHFHYDLHFILNGFTVRLKTGLVVQVIFLTALFALLTLRS